MVTKTQKDVIKAIIILIIILIISDLLGVIDFGNIFSAVIKGPTASIGSGGGGFGGGIG